ncbi:hypothetical protein [Lacrimispora amygdalina]|uniref:hypothetical protein n=1 Tax=Lacrimispora amygdalina TaxID=253257 RepID=UPI000BE32250|nr:hypothetical protein [Lacrimispora amygdalina]
MGMYDTICGDQVKCFYSYFEYQNEPYRSGGLLRYFNINDEVPYRTEDYNYTKNFNIINIHDIFDESMDESVLIGVRCGRVRFIKLLDQASDMDWINIQRCINYDGELLRIETNAEALKYVAALKKYMRQKSDYLENYMPCRKRINVLSHGLGNLLDEERIKRFAEIEKLDVERQKEWEAFLIFEKQIAEPLKNYFKTK